jgi:D-cysteine desulfhydrase
MIPDKLNLAQLPTPLQFLSRLSAELGGPRIWVKRDDLTGCALSGNKIRKLEFVLAQALAEGADTLLTCGGLQSNHCRATAVLGAQLGLKVHLILRGEPPEQPPDGNLLLDSLVGAEISCYPQNQYQHLPELIDYWLDFYRARGRKPFVIPTGASDGIGIWGYLHSVSELARQFREVGIRPSAIVCATGSGGTQAGLTLGCHLSQLDIPVLGFSVCDDAAYFHRKIREDIRDWEKRYSTSVDLAQLKIQVNDLYSGPGYGRATPEVFATIRHMASLEGLILDPVYTGKAFYGLVQEIKAGGFQGASDIVFVHTGGLFGLYAQRDELGLQVNPSAAGLIE